MQTVLTYLNLGIYTLFTGLLIAAAIIDARKRIIPNGIIIALIALWLIGFVATTAVLCTTGAPLPDALVAPRPPLDLSPVNAIAAALLFGGGSLLATTALERTTGRFALGGGDIKLLFAIGLFLGIEREAIALLLACATFIAVTLLIAVAPSKLRVAAPPSNSRPHALSDPFPFGPFLTLGGILALII